MKRIFSVLLCLFFAVSLFGCGTSEQLENKELSPIEELTEKEKEFYDALLIGLESAYNPSKIRILAIEESEMDIFRGYTYLKMQGTNMTGGTIVQTGKLVTFEIDTMKSLDLSIGDMVLDEELSEGNIYGVAWDDSSVGKINKALQYHWEELGIE